MNNRVQRTIEVNTSFLPEGRYELEYWEDGRNANKKPTEVNKKKIHLTTEKPLKIKMANGGGYVGIFTSVD